MPDREKVIQGLEYCFKTKGVRCYGCPYYSYDNCTEALHFEALTLLKDQEAKPTKTAGANNIPLKW